MQIQNTNKNTNTNTKYNTYWGNIIPSVVIIGAYRVYSHDIIFVHVADTHFSTGWISGICLRVPMSGLDPAIFIMLISYFTSTK